MFVEKFERGGGVRDIIPPMKFYVRVRSKTGPDKIYQLSAHGTEEEARQAAAKARENGEWVSVGVTPAPFQTGCPKPRRNSGRRSTSRRG